VDASGASAGSGIVDMNGSTDYLELFGYHTDTVSRSVVTGVDRTYVSIIKVGD
jgi:hypothetical protein